MHLIKSKAALLWMAAPVVMAGTPESVSVPAVEKSGQWLTPVIDIRARYEFGDVDGLDPSHALTLRERLGLRTMAWNGFSAFVEGEFSQAAVDDYHGGAPDADPFDPANTAITDPETNELNQGYLQYEGFDALLRAGRQRIKYDNEAFVGNVGWRQNEQTYDAISLEHHVGSLTWKYAWLNQVNRIFGSDADGALVVGPPPFSNVEDLATNTHLLNGSWNAGVATVGAYVYLMDFDRRESWDNRTFGASAKGKAGLVDLYGELAWQDQAGFAADDDALYAHAFAASEVAGQTITLGVEHLGAGFKTPLATAHAFNGYADAFVGGRIEGTHNGLTDIYLSHVMPVCFGVKWTNAVHAFGDNHPDAGYGWEFNSVLAKKFDDHFTAIAKFAHFESEGDAFVGAAALPTTTRVSVEMNYTF